MTAAMIAGVFGLVVLAYVSGYWTGARDEARWWHSRTTTSWPSDFIVKGGKESPNPPPPPVAHAAPPAPPPVANNDGGSDGTR